MIIHQLGNVSGVIINQYCVRKVKCIVSFSDVELLLSVNMLHVYFFPSEVMTAKVFASSKQSFWFSNSKYVYCLGKRWNGNASLTHIPYHITHRFPMTVAFKGFCEQRVTLFKEKFSNLPGRVHFFPIL